VNARFVVALLPPAVADAVTVTRRTWCFSR
jgi:hypothetical protein